MLNFQIATEEDQCRTTRAALDHELSGYEAAGKKERAEAVLDQIDIVEARLAELVGPIEDEGDGAKSEQGDGAKSEQGDGAKSEQAAKKGGVFGKKK